MKTPSSGVLAGADSEARSTLQKAGSQVAEEPKLQSASLRSSRQPPQSEPEEVQTPNAGSAWSAVSTPTTAHQLDARIAGRLCALSSDRGHLEKS